jgi:anti-sigma regulatory factor (Ser/Thr protein kinase)
MTAAAGDGRTLSLTLRGSPAEEVSRAQAEVSAFLGRHGEGPAAISRAELLLEEVALNVLRHGFDPPQTPEVAIRLAREPAGWSFDFEDRGRAFDPTTAPLPPPAPSLAEAKVGGFGLPLIRRIAQALRYERTEDGRNLFRLVLPPSDPLRP